jgi:hypothetical protein
MKAACLPPPDFTLVAARFEPSGGTYDLNSPALSTATTGQTVALAAYLAVRRGPATCPHVLTFAVSRDGVHVYTQVLSLNNCVSSTPARYAVNDKLDRAGTYVLTVTATVQGQSQRQTASLVVSRPVHIKPVTFSYHFDQLRLTDASGRAKTSFRAGEHFELLVVWHVRGLQGKREANVLFQFYAAGKRAPAISLTEQVTSTNGRNELKKESQLATPGRWTIHVTLSLKGKPQSKGVDLRVLR